MAKEDYFMEDDDDITFSLLNMDTVNRLRRDGKIEVPKKKVDVPKDKKWNEKQMASKILQGILSGSSVDDMADVMKAVIGNNQASAIRNTRTMVTSAENHGRLDSYNNLASKGVVMKKEWIATPDDRTRPTHVAIDGEQQDLNKPFSNGCMFPGDAKGPSEEVWMCRCAMGSHIVGFLRADGSVSKVQYDRDETLHDRQMEAEKKKRAKEYKYDNEKYMENLRSLSKPKENAIFQDARKTILPYNKDLLMEVTFSDWEKESNFIGIKEIDYSEIVTVQPFVQLGKLQKMTDVISTEDIALLKIGNKYYIKDGNHRVIANMLKGIKRSKFKVYRR